MEISKKFFSSLKKLTLFRHMTEAEITEFLSSAACTIRSYSKNTVFLHQGDVYNSLCIVVEGTSISEMDDFTGKSVVLGKFSSPFPVAPGFLFLENGRLPISLRSRTAVTVLFISKQSISEGCRQNDHFLNNFLILLSKRIEYLTERVSFHSCKTVREKLLLYLDSLKKGAGNAVIVPMSIEELARYFGVARPSLSQVISDLQKEGMISKTGRTIRFL